MNECLSLIDVFDSSDYRFEALMFINYIDFKH